MQDYNDRILGYIADVVRTADGKIVLVMSRRGWFGFAGPSLPIPIEAVAILGRHLNLLDIPRESLDELPIWRPSDGITIDRSDVIRIAISRR